MSKEDKEDEFPESDTIKADDDFEPVGNPAPPSDVDLDLLRGDRIGDTVYSGKWCIQTVMKMLQSNVVVKPEEADQSHDGQLEIVDMEEDLQNEVGVLWDMTSNVEVCQYLQSVGAIESIYHVIANSRCPRATEMCVGMLANIVTHSELWQILKSDTTLFSIMIPLFESNDQPVLLEVNRFFNTALSHPESSHCYSSMASQAQFVTQEMLRILSGSTNCELLKQATALSHLLMCLDTDDSKFNAVFADPDFIIAVLEASKEIGYDHETCSQSSVMHILHGFTTFQAGIDAMETCMEAITQAVIKYLRSLCYSLNLSANGDVISIIVTLLNHIFCRSLAVRLELLSSAKLLQCVLKILAALYRKFGMYNAIVNTPTTLTGNHTSGQAHHHGHRHAHDKHAADKTTAASSSWEASCAEEEESSHGRSDSVQRSWSERAGVGESTPTKQIVTPEASPRQKNPPKEAELLSWSERRMASPLVTEADVSSDVWKIPVDMKLKRKKTKQPTEDLFSLSKTEVSAGNETDSASGEVAHEKSDCQDEVNPAQGEQSARNAGSNVEDDASERIQIRHCSTDSQKSSGFSPSNEEDENMDYEQTNGRENSRNINTELNDNKEQKDSNSETTNLTENGYELSPSGDASITAFAADTEEKESWLMDESVADEMMRTEDDLNESKSSHFNLEKYHKLLRVTREFLEDFLNNMREGLVTDEGKPVLSDVLMFLDSNCRSSSLKLMVHCLRPSRSLSTPVGRLVHLASCSKKTRLHTLLLDLTKKTAAVKCPE